MNDIPILIPSQVEYIHDDVKVVKYGFGYSRDDKGNLIRKEEKYGVKFGEDVYVGSGVKVVRGSWRDTVIGDGTKIDNLCHIGHNVIIGKHCVIIAGVMFGGSSEIGDYSYIGMNTTIKQRVKIGKHVIIGAGSVVINDVPAYDIVAGNPAKSIKNKVHLTKEEIYQMVGY